MAHLHNKRKNIQDKIKREKDKKANNKRYIEENNNNEFELDKDFLGDDLFEDEFELDPYSESKDNLNNDEKELNNSSDYIQDEQRLDDISHSTKKQNHNREQRNNIRKDLRNFHKKVKKRRKHKKGLMRITLIAGIILVLLLPLALFMIVSSYAVTGSVTALSATVDPESRAELIAKGELDPNQTATKVPKDILGAEFQDFKADDSSSTSSSDKKTDSSSSKDNDNTANGTSDVRKKIIDLAQSRVDKKIPYSQSNPQNWDDHLDCSGLVQETFKRVGINLTRTTYTQIKECDKIDKKDAKEGDLIFFIENGSPEHVAIYAGNDMLIEEPQPNETAHKIKVYNMNGATQYWARPKALKDK